MRVNQKNAKRLMILAAFLLALLLPLNAFADPAMPIKQDLLEAGKKVYFKRCVWCHGVEGGGDGPSAERLYTRPRNFIQGTFKIRWTDSGELPRDEDLIRTVTNGLPGSAMPAWGEFLSSDEIKAVIQFVKSLVQDRDFSDEDEEINVYDMGSNPWNSTAPYHLEIPQEAIDQGKEIFIKNKCWECHGGEGRGDGNPTMKDDWGFPIVAANWQECWNWRGNRRKPYDPFNIVRTISTGLNGTPMPNFREQITVEDRWKIAAFVNSLCPRKKIDPLTNKPVNDFLIKSKYTEGEISIDPEDPMWQAPYDDNRLKPREETYTGDQYRAFIALAGQITRGERNFDPRVDNLWVTSRWSPKDNAVYYLVEYHLRFMSTDPEYPDMVAIQWPGKLQDLFGAEKPYFIFGDSKKPIDLWRAKFMAKDYVQTGAPKEEGYELDLSIEELVGNGYDGIQAKETEPTVQVVYSKYKQGKVAVMFKRSLTTENKETDVQIPSESFIPVSFMQWTGNFKEHDENMAISTWYYTILEPPVPDSVFYLPPVAAVAFACLQGWLVWMTRRTRKMYDEGKVL